MSFIKTRILEVSHAKMCNQVVMWLMSYFVRYLKISLVHALCTLILDSQRVFAPPDSCGEQPGRGATPDLVLRPVRFSCLLSRGKCNITRVQVVTKMFLTVQVKPYLIFSVNYKVHTLKPHHNDQQQGSPIMNGFQNHS